MRRALVILGGIFVGYACGAGLGALLVQLFSSNAHDKALEIAMTAAFVTGPAGAAAGAYAAWMWTRRRSRS